MWERVASEARGARVICKKELGIGRKVLGNRELLWEKIIGNKRGGRGPG